MKYKNLLDCILLSGIIFFHTSCIKKDDNKPAAQLPLVTTSDIGEKTQATALCGGNITSDGGGSVTARGVCWSTSQFPTISDYITTDGTGIGSFTSNITGLDGNTVYYLRAYATNSAGMAYGNEVTFKTYTGVVTDADGNVYYTVTIGAQVWMAANLRVTHYNNGTSVSGNYWWYNNDSLSLGKTFGALYNNNAVSTGKLAPTGWHVATNMDWQTLTTYLGGETPAGGKLKEAGTTHWLSPNDQATNETDFTALPGGERLGSGSYTNIYLFGYWLNSDETLYVMFYDGSACAWPGYSDSNDAYSIRCIKNI